MLIVVGGHTRNIGKTSVLCGMVVDGSTSDFKETSLRFLDRANVLVLAADAPLAWPQVPASRLRDKTRLPAYPPSYENLELIAAIRQTALKNAALSADHTR